MEELVLFRIFPSSASYVVRVIRFTNQWMQLYSNVIFVFYKNRFFDGDIAEIYLNDAMVNRQGFLSEYILQIYQLINSIRLIWAFLYSRLVYYGSYTVKLRWQTDLSVFLIIFLEIFLKSLDLSKGSITKMNIGAILMFLFQKYVWKSGVKILYN